MPTRSTASEAPKRDKTLVSLHRPHRGATPIAEYYGCVSSTTGAWSPAPCDRAAMTSIPDGQQFTAVECPVDRMPPYRPSSGALRIVAISDTHEYHRQLQLPPGDILIHCGDVTDCAVLQEPRKAQEALRDFLQWFKEQPFPIKVLIGGNHDAPMEALGKSRMRHAASPAIYLEHEVLDVLGVRIYGSPMSSGHSCNKAFQDTTLWPKTPLSADTPVLIVDQLPRSAHEPPALRHSTLAAVDKPHQVDILMTHACGSMRHAMDLAQRVRPKLQIGGHKHRYHGARTIAFFNRNEAKRWVFDRAIMSINAACSCGYGSRPPSVVDYITTSEIVAARQEQARPQPRPPRPEAAVAAPTPQQPRTDVEVPEVRERSRSLPQAPAKARAASVPPRQDVSSDSD